MLVLLSVLCITFLQEKAASNKQVFLKVHKGTMDNRSCFIPLGINKNKTQFTWNEKHDLSRYKLVAGRLQMTFGI